jgi:hypothetical protein
MFQCVIFVQVAVFAEFVLGKDLIISIEVEITTCYSSLGNQFNFFNWQSQDKYFAASAQSGIK